MPNWGGGILYVVNMELCHLIVDAGLLICAIVAGIVAYCEYKQKQKTDRAESFGKILMMLRDDPEIRRFIQDVDYGAFKFNGGFLESEGELIADKALSKLSYICYLKDNNLITDKEFSFFGYEIKRVLSNKDVQQYFDFIIHFAKEVDGKGDENVLPDFPFKSLIEYAMSEKLYHGCK